MKKVFAAVALFIGLGFAANAQESGSVVPSIDPNAPEMKFEAEVLDFGTVKFDANGVREFKIKNVVVCENYFDREITYKEKIQFIDKREEFKKYNEEMFYIGLENLMKNK